MLTSFSRLLYCLLITFSLVIVHSCTKDGSVSEKPTLGSTIGMVHPGTEKPYDTYIAIRVSFSINRFTRDSSYTIEAYGKISKNGIPVNAGPITIGNVIIPANPNNLYNYTYALEEGKALFGSSIPVQAPNSATTAGTVEIAVPKEFFPPGISLPESFINRAVAYRLAWNPDAANQYQKVQIQLSYYEGISQGNAPGMPNSIAALNYSVADNGSFTIPQADLSRFPKGSYVGLSIARASQSSTSGNIAYIAISEAHSIPLLVTE